MGVAQYLQSPRYFIVRTSALVVDPQQVMHLPRTIHAHAHVNVISLKHFSPGFINQSSIGLNTYRKVRDVVQDIAGPLTPSIKAPGANQAGLATVKPQEQQFLSSDIAVRTDPLKRRFKNLV
jgi:hypothetical protein